MFSLNYIHTKKEKATSEKTVKRCNEFGNMFSSKQTTHLQEIPIMG